MAVDQKLGIDGSDAVLETLGRHSLGCHSMGKLPPNPFCLWSASSARQFFSEPLLIEVDELRQVRIAVNGTGDVINSIL
jgi:hypothetical protein